MKSLIEIYESEKEAFNNFIGNSWRIVIFLRHLLQGRISIMPSLGSRRSFLRHVGLGTLAAAAAAETSHAVAAPDAKILGASGVKTIHTTPLPEAGGWGQKKYDKHHDRTGGSHYNSCRWHLLYFKNSSCWKASTAPALPHSQNYWPITLKIHFWHANRQAV